MNDKQSCLLSLFKELDGFLRQHKIRYYCAAGTVLGAIRHNGFIPWDDDIDVLMTRDEFSKFASAMELYGLPGHILVYHEKNREHHSTVARFIKEDTTMFCHHHIIGYAPAGISIDIFVLDPIPDGREEQLEFIAKLFAYSDFAAPTLSYSHRLPKRYLHVFEDYSQRASEVGLETVTEELEAELASYDETECSNYILRWGCVPYMYPKTLFGDPVYLPFEDVEIPVPEQWPSYLAIHYGCKWSEIPYIDQQDSHNTVFDPDDSYDRVYKLRDSMYKQEDLIALHDSAKKARRRCDAVAEDLRKHSADIHIRVCDAEIKERLKAAEASGISELYNNKRYGDVVDVYRPYLELQTSPIFMGALKHNAFGRWIDPIIIPVGEDDLICMIRSLIYTDEIRTAEKLVTMYNRAGKCSGEMLRIKQQLDDINRIYGAYYCGQYSKALESLAEIHEEETIPEAEKIFWLTKAASGLNASEEVQLQKIAGPEKAFPEFKKAWADHLWQKNDKENALLIYNDLMHSTRNGMILKDIKNKGLDLPDSLSETPAGAEGDPVLMHKISLAEEIADYCSEIGAELALMEDETGFELAIEAADAPKLIEYLNLHQKSSRKVLSWGCGTAIKDFVIKYADINTTYVDLRKPFTPDNRNIAVTIRILRKGSEKRRERVIETILNASADQKSARKGNTNPIRKLMVNAIVKTPDSIKKRIRKRAFNKLSAKAADKKSGDYYYCVSGSGSAPKTETAEYIAFDKEKTIGKLDDYRKKAASMPMEQKNPMYFVQSSVIPADSVLTREDSSVIPALNWREYSVTHREALEKEREVRRVWRQLICAYDE